jgi:hypothetical protein
MSDSPTTIYASLGSKNIAQIVIKLILCSSILILDLVTL